VSGYIVEEKVEIAKRHLVPKQIKEHGLTKSHLSFAKNSLDEIINNYTRESGVRAMEKKIATVIRKVAKKIAMEEDYDKNIKLNDIVEYLGAPAYQREKYENNDFAGVTTGLAWTSVGGTILFIEAAINKGNGQLNLIKFKAEEIGIDPEIFNNYNIHLHVPEGAVPKDGPSAGITMVTSIVSALTQRKVKKNLAMTGEITLRGKVLPVGGIKEKILAAKRADIKEIILSVENKKDVEEIKELYIRGLKFHFVNTIMEVIDIAILKQKVKNPIKIKLKE